MAAAHAGAILRQLHRLVSSRAIAEKTDSQLLRDFTAGRHEEAFAALLHRHGRLVWSVCRHMLPHEHDAEDAFQATFLVLARRAASIRRTEEVASWLHGVAYRIARRARMTAIKRNRRETPLAYEPPAAPGSDLAWRELQAILDEELQRLPEKYRSPFIMCCLEGRSRAEAAAELGWKEGTLSSRIAHARALLQERLTRRGVMLSAALTAGVMWNQPASAALMQATQKSASLVAAGRLVSIAATPTVAALVDSAAGMVGAKTKLAIIAVVAGLVVVAGAAFREHEEQPKPTKPKAASETVEQVRIAASHFRASRPIGDARYSFDGKRIVGYAGSNIYVWDAGDGSILRTIDTKLEPLDDPAKYDQKELAFALNPKFGQVACGGVKNGKTILQIWDYQTGKPVAEKSSTCDALQVLAWTPDGKKLLERTNVGWWQATGWKLIVRDEQLEVLKSHDLPWKFGEWGTVMCPASDGQQVVLWQSGREPTVVDLDSGNVVRTIAYDKNAGPSSDLAFSSDGKLLAATDTNNILLLRSSTGEIVKKLPVHRGGWWKPRPLFSPDGKSLYVWDHRPYAYDVATGKELWKATFRTTHTVQMRLCDLTPDGGTLLVRHGHALARLSAKTGAELDAPSGPASPAGLVWSPDGQMLFTRKENHDRTWTAWEPTSGKRLYDLLQTGHVRDEDWKMLPDLFFIHGGKEIVTGLEKSESTERVGPKELLVFDAATGRCLRRLGDPLPDETFRWMHPIAVDGDGKSVLMQAFAVSAPAGPGGGAGSDQSAELQYAAVWWDPVKNAGGREWTAVGDRITPPRHFAPYAFTIRLNYSSPSVPVERAAPALVRCYTLPDGKLLHELKTDFAHVDLDRAHGNFFLSAGYNGKWVNRANFTTFRRTTPVAYELWELSSREKVRVFEQDLEDSAMLGLGGQYVVRLVGDTGFEIYEPFVLKRSVAKVATPFRPKQLEFCADGSKCAASLSDASVVVWDAKPWRTKIDEQIAKEVPAALKPLWDDLAKDATTGLRAARLLSAAGDKAVSLLDSKIEVKKPLLEADVKQWISDLDAPVFADREKAEKALREMSAQAEPHLNEALLGDPSPELKRRIGKLLKAIELHSLTPSEHRELRAVQALRWMDTEASRSLLVKWSKGDPAAGLTVAAKRAAQERSKR